MEKEFSIFVGEHSDEADIFEFAISDLAHSWPVTVEEYEDIEREFEEEDGYEACNEYKVTLSINKV